MSSFVFGRNNLALTVFVPYNCNNTCPFCTSRACYQRMRPSAEDVTYQIERIFRDFHFPIRDVVFTGGEPMADLPTLKRLVGMIPDALDVYINTTLLSNGVAEFADFVNGTRKIKGINVSRHAAAYDEDLLQLRGIAEDEAVRLFEKPVRINCVLTEAEGNEKCGDVIDRWKPYAPNVNLCFRRDFRERLTERDLHNPYDDTAVVLQSMIPYRSHSQCNVCDTLRFSDAEDGGFVVSYHRGQRKSSIYYPERDVLEINDLIIFPDGTFAYDWEDTSIKRQHELETAYRALRLSDEQIRNLAPAYPAPLPRFSVPCGCCTDLSDNRHTCGIGRAVGSCGSSGCGGSISIC